MATDSEKPRIHRTLVIVGVTIAILVGLHLLPGLALVLLLIFAGVLFGILLDGLASLISRRLRFNHRAALALVIAVLFGLAALFGWLAGPQISQQTAALLRQLPSSVNAIRTELTHTDWGRAVISNLPPGAQMRWPMETVLGKLPGAFSVTVEMVAAIVFVFFVGLYFAANSDAYVEPLLRLLPKDRRMRGHQVAFAVRSALRWWLLGRAIAMSVIGSLTALALLLVNVPLALTLGVISGLLVFVPYIGAIVAAVPAMLLALTQSPVKALWVALIYTGIHVFEGYCVTPLVQQRTIAVPPAVLLSVQVLIGALFGPVGLLLATPIAVAAIVLVQMLYVQDVLGEEVAVLGTH
jgi:predicted PurR-regulated permease PerM